MNPAPTPAELAEEMYTSLVAAYAPYNSAAIARASTVPGTSATIFVVNESAIQAVFTAFPTPDPTDSANMVTTFSYVPVPAPAPPPEYTLTNVIAAGLIWGVMTISATWPPDGTSVLINGKNYKLYADDAGFGHIAVLQPS